MTRLEVRNFIQEIGIIPAVRVASPEDALFAAEAVRTGGIPVVEITLTVPGAVDVIRTLSAKFPDMVVGAGTVLNVETARQCLDAGAKFLTSPGLVMKVVEFAHKHNVVVFPGALTPTEVIAAWDAGADFVKVFPCTQAGGPGYIRALKVPLPQVPLIASGGVNQQTVSGFIHAGAVAVGVGSELIPAEALMNRQESQIFELARRFLTMIQEARLPPVGWHGTQGVA
jgi:2-dehydro-3-deoxyphosphogluconate aldolase / (4S)-4-hydroxy-2-oxoglutarate aldolase